MKQKQIITVLIDGFVSNKNPSTVTSKKNNNIISLFRRLQAELVKLKAQCKDESSRIRLLSMEKEQLQYRLQQRHGNL